ncbi:MAG: segregation/condensation protein A [Anaerolineales bacterium]|nr:segregation/condensation protein A [Anaerolineales bacterium]
MLSQSNYTVQIPVYEGPLDLLLDLIQRAELDITTISLATVTDQYLVYVHTLQEISADDVSVFLVIAAKLIQIKSEALLPRPKEREPGEEDVGQSLVEQLIQYKRFKEIANLLQERQVQGLKTYLRIAPPPKVEGKLDLSGVSLVDLLQAVESIFAHQQEKQALGTVITPPKITIREKIELITRTMKEIDRTAFSDLIGEKPTRLEVVVTFLALLELVKRYRVAATQEGLFTDIRIERLEDWDDTEEIEIEFE